MPDNWAYVIGAYGLALVVFGAYWLRLGRRERELTALVAGRQDREARVDRHPVRTAPPPRPRPPRTEAASRTPRP